MDISEEVREAAKRVVYGGLIIVDPTQAFLHDGRPTVLPSAVIGQYMVAGGEVVGFEPNTGYRMVVRP